MVRLLLDHCADPDAADDVGHRPLHVAAQRGEVETTDLLLSAGAKPFAETLAGTTPLACAALWGHRRVVERLLDERPPADVLDAAMLDAALGGQSQVVPLLAGAGAGVNTRAADGTTPLHQAARAGDTRMFLLLLGLGADLNARDKSGNTPIDAARRDGRQEILDAARRWNEVGRLPAAGDSESTG